MFSRRDVKAKTPPPRGNRVDTIRPAFHRSQVAISLHIEKLGKATVVRLAGRLDAHGASEVEPDLAPIAARSAVVMDVTGVTYISSAGLRIFVNLHKKLHAQGGRLFIAGLQPYCREVMRVAALGRFFQIFETVEAALTESGAGLDTCRTDCGKFIFHPGSDEPGSIEILGHIEDVLAARITPEHVRNKKFSAKAYSLGLGGLGQSVEEVLPLMGEMMTIGGTMVWLPTDGNDTPDFLVPQQDSDSVVIRTGFNASLKGKFNEYIEFESAAAAGAPLEDIYAALFSLARERRPDYRGALGLAMRAEVGQVYGSGAVKAPIASQAPENGKWITDPSNYNAWFEVDETPRHRDVTGLICGIGLDLDADLSVFDPLYRDATFYLNPGNTATRFHDKLHNHGVLFRPFPLGEKPFSLEREIQSVVEQGEFIDMRHLFDKTTILWALIGVIYVQDFRPDAG